MKPAIYYVLEVLGGYSGGTNSFLSMWFEDDVKQMHGAMPSAYERNCCTHSVPTNGDSFRGLRGVGWEEGASAGFLSPLIAMQAKFRTELE